MTKDLRLFLIRSWVGFLIVSTIFVLAGCETPRVRQNRIDQCRESCASLGATNYQINPWSGSYTTPCMCTFPIKSEAIE